MTINLEIDDKIVENAKEFYVNVMRYDESTGLVALRREDGKWWVKTVNCSACGECCRYISDGNPNFTTATKDGTKTICQYLNGNLCSAGIHRPFSCIMDWHDDPETRPKNCTEVFKEI